MTVCDCGKSHPWEPESCPSAIRQRLDALEQGGREAAIAEIREELGRKAGEALAVAVDARDWGLVEQIAAALSVNDP